MVKLSFIEKLKLLKNIIFQSPILSIGLIILIIVVLSMFKGMKQRKILLGIYLTVLLSLAFLYGNTITSLFDGMMDHIFSTIYFPTPVAYIVMFFLSNIILMVSIVNKKTTKLVRKINITTCSIILFLSVISLNLIVKNNIDIYSQSSLYTNTNLLATIELTMIIFAIWMILLCLIKIIDSLTKTTEKSISFEEKPIFHVEPILNHFEEEVPSAKEVHAMLQKNHIIAANPQLYDENGNVLFPNENRLEKINYEQEQEKVNIVRKICQKETLDITDYKQLRNVVEVAIESNSLEEFELEKLVHIFE